MFKLVPKIYSLVEQNTNSEKVYSLTEYANEFVTPKKIYGSLESKAIRVWNNFAKENTSSGVLLSGDSGAGKSLTANLLSNIAISKGIPVIYVAGVQITPYTIKYLSMFIDVVIYIDEFRKLISDLGEDLILSFLSDSNFKRLFILTENNIRHISPFILNRPGRIKYHYTFDKLELSVIDQYCADYDIDSSFIKSIKDLYNRSITFSFDHLQALVKEHLDYPNDSIDTLLECLNMKILAKEKPMEILDIINTLTNNSVKDFIIRRDNLLLSDIKRGYNLCVVLKLENERVVLGIRNDNIIEDNDETIKFKDESFEITLKKDKSYG